MIGFEACRCYIYNGLDNWTMFLYETHLIDEQKWFITKFVIKLYTLAFKGQDFRPRRMV